jgi:abequosyltransferase
MTVPATSNCIILSICITTRNRAEFLRQTMESILPQMTDRSEIVIVDGASSDHTGDVASYFQVISTNVRYFRMERNSGVDRDYNTSVELARGEYCWFMSDDDLLNPGAIQTVLAETAKGYSAMVVNAEDWNADFTERLHERRLHFDHNRVYAPSEREALFIDTAHHLSFIPALVIRREIWMSREREKYFGSWFAHVGVVFQAPLPTGAILIAAPLVAIRNENISWTGRMFEIWMIRWPTLIWSFDNLSDSSKERICRKNPHENWRTLLAYRTKGTYSFKEYRQHILPNTADFRLRILPAIIAVIPPSWVNTLSLIYKNKKLPRR